MKVFRSSTECARENELADTPDGCGWRVRRDDTKWFFCKGHKPFRCFRFIPFWHVTRWGWLPFNKGWSCLWLNRGCDEYHNLSRWFIVPFVGEFVWFQNLYGDQGPEHVHAYRNGEWIGADVPGCIVCKEMKDEMLSE